MSKSTHDLGTERFVVLQLLRDDHPERWSRAELERELQGVVSDALGRALASLAGEGVVVLDGEVVRASRCVRRVHALGVICI
jgi:hypothetical protein